MIKSLHLHTVPPSDFTAALTDNVSRASVLAGLCSPCPTHMQNYQTANAQVLEFHDIPFGGPAAGGGGLDRLPSTTSYVSAAAVVQNYAGDSQGRVAVM